MTKYGSARRAGLLAVTCAAVLASTARADGIRQVGPMINLTEGQGSRWCTAAYGGPGSDHYLVLWLNTTAQEPYRLKGRCIAASTGDLAGPEFVFGDWLGLGVPVYLPDQACWAVTYYTQTEAGGDVFLQKVGPAGKIGLPVAMVQESSYQMRAHMDRDFERDRLFVAWEDYRSGNNGKPQIRGHLFNTNGQPIDGIQEVLVGAATGYHQTDPMVAYNPLRDEFLVIWADYRNDAYRTSDRENNYVDVYAQRINALTGLPIGGNIPVHSPFVPGLPYVTDEQDTPGGLQCNTNPASPLYGTYFLGVQKLEKLTGTGWTTRGRILNSDATLRGDAFNISYPSRGGAAGCAYNPHDDTYVATYLDWRFNISAEVFPAAGGESLFIPGPIMGEGDWEKNYGWMALRPSDGQCLQVTTLFENLITHEMRYALVAQRFVRDATPPAGVSELTATPGLRRVTLRWRNPGDADFKATLIRVRPDACPTGTSDGTLLVDQTGAAGASDSLVHGSLTPGATYYYAAFAHDGTANFAPGVCISVTLGRPGDIDLDGDVDQSDFGYFQRCLSGSGMPIADDCEDADFDADGDVDGADCESFRACMGGVNQPPGC